MALFLDRKIDIDGPRNAVIILTGALKNDEQRISVIDISKLSDSPKKVKISSIVWLFEEKMKARLIWGPDEFVLPMESRNAIRFEHGLMCPKPEKWNGHIEMDVLGVTKGNDFTDHYFFLQLELDKQGTR